MPPEAEHFPIGLAMNRNLTIKMGNCNHRTYVPELVALVRAGIVSPSEVTSADRRAAGRDRGLRGVRPAAEGWHKVVLDPSAA